MIHYDKLVEFERGLNPARPENSVQVPVILGYGEISSIFEISSHPNIAFKRMPLFTDVPSALDYEKKYHEYCSFLAKAGLLLPESSTALVDLPGRPVVLYIAQEKTGTEEFIHKKVFQDKDMSVTEQVRDVLLAMKKVWQYNDTHREDVELSLDSQLSNWVLHDGKLLFVDTSTPLFRKQGEEQMDPEPLLQSSPAFLRWILRAFFLDDVMNRYYDLRLVSIDLVANLYKEQRSDLIPPVLELVNELFCDRFDAITEKEIDSYYREDRLIWSLFLSFRRIDRFITEKIFRSGYQFILPGKIRR